MHTIVLPDSVWLDALDPLASDMQAELGLPAPAYRKRGKGGQRIYTNVPTPVALELADYLEDRGFGLAIGADPDPVYARTRQTAAKIKAAVSN